MSCALIALLGDPTVPPPPSTEDGDQRCLAVDLDVAGRITEGWPKVGVYRGVSVPRARVEAAVSDRGVTARFGFGTARSGGETGYLGVDGESIVPVVQVAEARVALPKLGVQGSLGLIDDPWVVPSERVWGLNSVALSFGNQAGWLERSDLGGRIAWTAPRGFASASVTLSSGEGLRRRERNAGLDTTFTATLRPLAKAEAPESFEIAAFARDGSRGLGLARDHRVGARVTTRTGVVDAGVEGLAAWGVDGDAERAPIGGAAWGVVRPWGPLQGFVRVDGAREIPGDAASGWRTLRVGVGSGLPLDGDALGRVWVGFETGSAGDTATPIAGADGLARWDRLWLQFDVHLRGAVALQAEDR